MPDTVELIGYVSALLTTVSFVPQVLQTLRTRDVRSISLSMYALFTTGIAGWLVYGLLMRAWPIVAANAVTLSLASIILVLKLRYR